jgi:hypothetical protein
MRSRKFAGRLCDSLLPSCAAVVLLAGATSAATTSTMVIYPTTTRPRLTTTTRAHMTTTTSPSTTTTTIGVPVTGSCTTITACETALMATLPSPTTATNGKERRIARLLTRLGNRALHEVGKATSAKASHQARLFKKANRTLERIRTVADKAEAKGSLSVPVGPIDADVTAFMSLDHP